MPKVLSSQNIVMPGANHTLAQTGAGWGYWDSRYAGMPLQFVYQAPFPIDACLVDLPLGVPGGGDFYVYCSSLPESTALTNRSAGTMGFIVPSQPDNGFDFDVLSPRNLIGNVTVDWWINSTSGSTLATWGRENITIQAAQLVAESHVSESVLLPAGYDNVSVQGWSSYPVSLTLGSGQPAYLDSVGFTASWDWTHSYQGSQTFRVDLYTQSFDPLNVSLTEVVF